MQKQLQERRWEFEMADNPFEKPVNKPVEKPTDPIYDKPKHPVAEKVVKEEVKSEVKEKALADEKAAAEKTQLLNEIGRILNQHDGESNVPVHHEYWAKVARYRAM